MELSIPRLAVAWWVDKRTFYVLRLEHPGGTTTFQTVKMNEPLSDDLFKFVPPEGSRKLE